MRNVIKLEEYRFKSDGTSVRERRMLRAYARFRAKHHRLMQERDKKLKEALEQVDWPTQASGYEI